jgi:A/G-specific adenine glycosylase
LPWRKSFNGEQINESTLKLETQPIRNPYATWISETMLQQTQVTTVIDHFVNWMKLFPNIETLAKAREDKVLKAWAGLGYYSRAKNILNTAQFITENYSGNFPSEREKLLGLKGIGEYTAGAIASLAFNLPEPILDGNLIRVFSRLYGINFLPVSPEQKKIYWQWSKHWVASGEPALINEGLMELGALICVLFRNIVWHFKKKSKGIFHLRRFEKKLKIFSELL